MAAPFAASITAVPAENLICGAETWQARRVRLIEKPKPAF
jgi:hypothetical protein